MEQKPPGIQQVKSCFFESSSFFVFRKRKNILKKAQKQ
jgi:hypothetical protein